VSQEEDAAAADGCDSSGIADLTLAEQYAPTEEQQRHLLRGWDSFRL
jgi:hypothetical protein